MEILEWYGVWVVLVCAGLLLFATEVMLNGWSRWMNALALVAIAVVLGYFFRCDSQLFLGGVVFVNAPLHTAVHAAEVVR